MAPIPPLGAPCQEEIKAPQLRGDDTNLSIRRVLEVVTDLSARVDDKLDATDRIPLPLDDLELNSSYPNAFVANFTYPQAFAAEGNILYQNGTSSSDLITNFTSGNIDVSDHVSSSMSRLHEFQIIKAVVLAAVTVVILISICKMVFQLFVRYTVKHDK
ncbi:uncharacterized protein [Periplaneta americana]|uniref:uncharacterized protein n=1 Tax=Periplaneta americana TaxID=6978 RepID=UPI0037E869D2